MKATASSLAQRTADLAKIHIARKELGMSEDEYRDLVFTLFGKRSAGDLDTQGRWQLIGHLKKLGFKPKGKQPGQAHKDLSSSKADLERKIGWQLGQLGKPWDYAYGIARRICPDVQKFEFLTVEQLGHISSALARTMRSVKGEA